MGKKSKAAKKRAVKSLAAYHNALTKEFKDNKKNSAKVISALVVYGD